ncbi:ATP-binding protein [Microbispora sp. NPDC049125]|uniref:ATP-binding protein n=1 Tax=Microbispora sp. NPDC049125 TaxID=3154929 RepID=UPI00346733C1
MGIRHMAYRVEHRLREDLASVPAARELAVRALAACSYRGRHDDVLLVVSELVTNALRHGDGSPVLRLSGGVTWMRVEVADDGAGLPRLRRRGRMDGWGLNLIQQLAAGWGVDRRATRDGKGEGPGKVVWCELTARLTLVDAVSESSHA